MSFQQYFQVFDMNFNICFQHLVLLEMISFVRYLKQLRKSVLYYVNNLGTKLLSTCYAYLWWIPSKYIFFNNTVYVQDGSFLSVALGLPVV